jgi:hypothetical protein
VPVQSTVVDQRVRGVYGKAEILGNFVSLSNFSRRATREALRLPLFMPVAVITEGGNIHTIHPWCMDALAMLTQKD